MLEDHKHSSSFLVLLDFMATNGHWVWNGVGIGFRMMGQRLRRLGLPLSADYQSRR